MSESPIRATLEPSPAAKNRMVAAQADEVPRERQQVGVELVPVHQETPLSWQYALLFPPWLRPISSPDNSIGTPCDSIRVASRLRC